MRAVIDIETERLVDPEKVHCIVCREIGSDGYKLFENVHENPGPFLEYAEAVDYWIGHNLLGFDFPALKRIVPGFNYDLAQTLDTLVVSRFLKYTIDGGHSLEAWGDRLGFPKVGAELTDFSEYTPLIRDRCIQDTLINVALYEYVLPYTSRLEYAAALETEHRMAALAHSLHKNGMTFYLKDAVTFWEELTARLKELDESLSSSLPSKVEIIKEITPSLTKKGTLNLKDFSWLPKKANDLSFFSPEIEYSIIRITPFNPASLKDIKDYLNDVGWKPTDKTKGHIDFLKSRKKDSDKKAYYEKYGWKVNEENLKTVSKEAPQVVHNLVERLLLASRVSDLEEWIGLTGYALTGTEPPTEEVIIHGTFLPIGAWTQRMAHQNPNMANVPTLARMRALWGVSSGKKQVGVDAEGIQMRIFAHYVNDKELINAIVSGRKEDQTDIHSVNRKALGTVCQTRDAAKTFIYAWLLGAGVSKVAEILGCSFDEAKRAVTEFIEFYPGLGVLKNTQIPEDFRRGYFIGLDGRPVVTPSSSDHYVLAGYLQNGEAIVMKRAAVYIDQQIKLQGLPVKFMNFVHDEFQFECDPSEEVLTRISELAKDGIVRQGIELNLNCPLAAEAKIGNNWQECH